MYLEKAIQIASAAHAGQTDKCGLPYILHPLRVMMVFTADIYMSVAVLHDVVEDTDVTIEDLKKEGFHPHLTDAVNAMTKKKNEKYEDYLNRVCENEIAKHVKLADIRDNSSPARLYKLEPETITRLTSKYAKAVKFLESHYSDYY